MSKLFTNNYINQLINSLIGAGLFIAGICILRDPSIVDLGADKRGDELFADLLFKMSKELGYDFDMVQLKNDVYRPNAHVNLENAQIAVLDGWAKILNNEKSLQMEITKLPPIQQPPTPQ